MKVIGEAHVILGGKLKELLMVSICVSLITLKRYRKSLIVLCNVSHNPSSDNWNALHWLLGYLRGTMN